jgi:hypothetical protein
MSGLGINPTKAKLVGFLAVSGTKPNQTTPQKLDCCRVAWTRCSQYHSVLHTLCCMQKVGCNNVILPFIPGWLTTSNTCTFTEPSSLIAGCENYRNCHLEKGIHCCGIWVPIHNTSQRW